MTDYDMAICKVESDFGRGSGFFISKNGYFVTNNHIISKGFSSKWGIGFEYSKRIKVISSLGIYDASLAMNSETSEPIHHDYAILKVDIETKEYFNISKILETSLRDRVISVGYPSGFKGPIITSGIISALNIINSRIDSTIETSRYVTDTVITYGNSGGPLIRESDGKVIGISNMGYTIKEFDRNILESYLRDDVKIEEKLRFLVKFVLKYMQTGLNYAVPIDYVIKDPIFKFIKEENDT